MPTQRTLLRVAGRTAIMASALLLSACWFFTDGDTDSDTRSDRPSTCRNIGETTCARYDLIGVRDSGCELTYSNCNDVCQDDGWARSAGCGWEPRANENRCLCTNDETCECSSTDARCYDDNTILYCSDGCHWYGDDCDEVCLDSGYDHSVGCDYDSGSGVDACFCSDEPECECVYGDYACGSDFTILTCDGCSWYEIDCDGVCAENGQGRSTGCGYDDYYGGDSCFCEGTYDPGYDTCECVYGDYACWDTYTIASCDDGCSWYTTDCDEVCWSYGYDDSTGCGYDPGYGDTCFCNRY